MPICLAGSLLLQDPPETSAPKQQQNVENSVDLSPWQMLRTKQYWLCAGAVCFSTPAVLLFSPIILNPEHVAWETEWYTRMCTTNFNDVPEWAQVAVGVCASMGTMAGYGDGLFGPSDPVSPQMACTVMLRYL